MVGDSVVVGVVMLGGVAVVVGFRMLTGGSLGVVWSRRLAFLSSVVDAATAAKSPSNAGEQARVGRRTHRLLAVVEAT